MAHRTVGNMEGTREVTGVEGGEKETSIMTTPSQADPLPAVLVVLTVTTGLVDAVSGACILLITVACAMHPASKAVSGNTHQ